VQAGNAHAMPDTVHSSSRSEHILAQATGESRRLGGISADGPTGPCGIAAGLETRSTDKHADLRTNACLNDVIRHAEIQQSLTDGGEPR
jgi:hypothetical protein